MAETMDAVDKTNTTLSHVVSSINECQSIIGIGADPIRPNPRKLDG